MNMLAAEPIPALDIDRRYRLSRHLQLRPSHDGFVAESLITGHCEILPNAAALRILLSLTMPIRLADVFASLGHGSASALCAFFGRCLKGGLITEIADDGSAAEDSILSLQHWEPHDLAFHLRSRRGRNTAPVGATWWLAEKVPPEPPRRPARAKIMGVVPLPSADLEYLQRQDRTLTSVLESRRSRYSVEPFSLQALAALLYRACRVTDTVGWKGLVRKVYPSGGSLHSLEMYLVSYRCIGLERGGYRYDPFEHRLEWLSALNSDFLELLREAQLATRELTDLPSGLLVLSSRFRRVTRKYQSLAYHVILQEVGAVYQTVYLVAETLGLSVSALGSGDSDRFAQAFETDFFAESSVGEMIVGGAPPA